LENNLSDQTCGSSEEEEPQYGPQNKTFQQPNIRVGTIMQEDVYEMINFTKFGGPLGGGTTKIELLSCSA